MVYGTCHELVTGANLNQRSHHNGGPHIVGSWDDIGYTMIYRYTQEVSHTQNPWWESDGGALGFFDLQMVPALCER